MRSGAVANVTRSIVSGDTVTGLVVTYAPGDTSPPHICGSAVVVNYVLSGSIRVQSSDGKHQVFNKGDSWTENSIGQLKANENASEIVPAKLLVSIVRNTEGEGAADKKKSVTH